MIAFPSWVSDTNTAAGLPKREPEVVYRDRPIEVCPDLSRLNRADRRAVEVIARRYGWKLPRP